ncbi:unnamed protein product [Urochloa humidicola]
MFSCACTAWSTSGSTCSLSSSSATWRTLRSGRHGSSLHGRELVRVGDHGVLWVQRDHQRFSMRMSNELGARQVPRAAKFSILVVLMSSVAIGLAFFVAVLCSLQDVYDAPFMERPEVACVVATGESLGVVRCCWGSLSASGLHVGQDEHLALFIVSIEVKASNRRCYTQIEATSWLWREEATLVAVMSNKPLRWISGDRLFHTSAVSWVSSNVLWTRSHLFVVALVEVVFVLAQVEYASSASLLMSSLCGKAMNRIIVF